jgi:hypothetical protein
MFAAKNTTTAPSPSSITNKGTNSFIQPKLSIGKSDDKYEVEADHVADQVVAKSNEPTTPFFPATPSIQKQSEEETIQEKSLVDSITPVVQLNTEEEVQEKCDDCEGEESVQKMEDGEPQVQEKAIQESISPIQKNEEEEVVQEKCEECEKKEAVSENSNDTGDIQKCSACEEKSVQKKEGSTPDKGSNVESQLKASKGAGSPMSSETKSSMESGFGANFSNVKIHTDSTAVQMNKSLGAQAFTNGNDVYFNEGKYNPNSDSGKHLLAHELTHTVQQNGNNGTLNKKSEFPVQLTEDPCSEQPEGGSEEQAASTETAPPASCTPSDPTPPQPAEGQEEPDQEEVPQSISSEEGASLDERQGNAPPPDQDAPQGEENISESAEGAQEPQGPCDVQEQGADQGGVAEPSSGAATADISTVPPQIEGGQEGATNQETTNQENNTPQDNGNGNGDFIATAANSGISPLIVRSGLGELASPELQQERDTNRVNSDVSIEQIGTTQDSISQLNNGPIHFIEPKGKNKKELQKYNEASATASAFLSSGVSKTQSLISEGIATTSILREQIANKRLNIQSDIARKRAGTSATFGSHKVSANIKAETTKINLGIQHDITLSQIETVAITAIANVEQLHQTKVAALDQKYTGNITAINEGYRTGYNDLITLGNTMSARVTSVANQKSSDYRRGVGASASDRNKIVNREKDGFWDGYLTYNRWMARADSAQEVGEQYSDGMKEQAKSKADFMLCGKGRALDTASIIYEEGVRNLQCVLTNSLSSIERQKQAAIMQATFAQQELTSNIDNALSATLNQLEQKEALQLQIINDFGIRQVMSIERDGESAITTTLTGVNEASIKLHTFLSEYKNTVTTNETPDINEFSTNLEGLNGQFENDFTTAQTTIQSAIEASATAIETSEVTALSAISAMYQQGITDGRNITQSFNGVIDQLLSSGIDSYTQLSANTLLGIQGEQTNATNILTAIVTSISDIYDRSVASIASTFSQTKEDMQTGMQNTIDNDLEVKICSEAEKAASDVQPWWKTALKILLVIIVIVIVIAVAPALIAAIGPAIAGLAGSLGAGAALAGSIGTFLAPVIGGAILGAVSGAVIQVGNNLIDVAGTDRELTWESVTKGVWGAVIAGAIGGAFGGLGGQFAQVILGRFGAALSGSMQKVAEFGIDIAFDVVGTLLGDLAAGNPITLEGLLIGVGIGAGIQIGTSGLGFIVGKVRGGTPDADVNVPRADTDVDTPRTGTDADAPRTDTDADAPRTDTDADAPRTDTDADAPRTDVDAEAPKTPEQKQDVLDDNRSKRLDEMTPEQRRIDLEEVGNNRPKQVDPDSEFATNYDVEIQSNGHTYRRRKDGRGWCRFSAQECGIDGDELPGDVRRWLDDNDRMLRENDTFDDTPENRRNAEDDARRDIEEDPDLGRPKQDEDIPETDEARFKRAEEELTNNQDIIDDAYDRYKRNKEVTNRRHRRRGEPEETVRSKDEWLDGEVTDSGARRGGFRNTLKGRVGEYHGDQYLNNNGYQKLSHGGELVTLEAPPQGRGLDGIWEKNGTLYVTDTKFNTSELTALQKTDAWLLQQIDLLDGPLRTRMQNAFDNQTLQKMVVHVDVNGAVTLRPWG